MTATEKRQLEAVRDNGANLAKGAIVFLALVIAFSLAASGYALYDRFNATNVLRTQLEIEARTQASFNERIREVSLEYCTEIERLKKANRDRALEAYRNLNETLRLLELERTPAIVARAKRDRDAALRRFSGEPCPRPPLPNIKRPHPLPRG